jgi:hypothetical protein
MSSGMAIAAVSYLLRALLFETFTDEETSAVTGSIVAATTLPPARVAVGEQEVPQVNVFLYRLTPNPAWRNVGLPARDARGDRQANPPLALDLHYVLSAYGHSELQSELLLGYAMQALHEHPVLLRPQILATLRDLTGAAGMPNALRDSDIAEQVEQIRISPQAIGTDEMSRLWSTFQAPYRPSAAYHVSVVLIDRRTPARVARPVLRVGPGNDGRDGPRIVPGLVPPLPSIADAVAPHGHPSLRLGDTLTLLGHDLAAPGATSRVRITHLPSQAERSLGVDSGSTASAVNVTLPNAPAEWRAGIHTAAVVVRFPDGTERESNALPISIAPRVAGDAAAVPGPNDTVTFTLRSEPVAWPGQRISAIVGGREIGGPSLLATETADLNFRVRAGDLPSGVHPVRLRIDGVEGLAVDRSGSSPAFITTPSVTVP